MRQLPELVRFDKEFNIKDLTVKTFMTFVQTAETVLKYSDAYLAEVADTSLVKYGALKILQTNGGTLTPGELARWMFKQPQTITTLVERLKREGFVETKRQSDNRKSIDVVLTDKGRDLIEKVDPLATALAQDVVSPSEESAAMEFINSLEVLKKNSWDGLAELKGIE